MTNRQVTTDEILNAQRMQAWERAKGELRSMRVTFISRQSQFEAFDAALSAFITLVESEGLHE